MNNSPKNRKHFRACNLCEAICGLEITLDAASDEILSIKGDALDPFSRGHVCPKAVALKDVYSDANRLKQPVRRTADGWQTIGWDEAFREVAERLRAVQAAHGRDAVGVYTGNPAVHNFGTLLTRPTFLRAVGSRNNFTATSVDQLPHHFAAWQMFGHSLLIPVPDVDRTDFMLILGANPAASNGSLMTAPGIMRRLRAIQERGGKTVVVDPRRTETARAADEHFFIKPGTDVYFLLSLVYAILQTNAEKPNFDFVEPAEIETLRNLAADFAPEKTAAQTGIAASDVRRLAQNLTDSKTAVVYGRMGVSTQEFGGLCQWLINALNILTGNFDSAGGAMFTAPAVDLLATAKPGKAVFNRWQTSVRGLPEFEGELPVAAMQEEIAEGNIKALVTISGNPVLSTPNGAALEKSFKHLDFMVAVDIYINETTRHASVILPPTTGLETAHYDLVFHHLAVRNTAKFSAPLYEKSENQRHDWEIFAALTALLTGDANKAFNPEEKIADGLKFGFYGARGLTLEQLKANPHGVDLGALRPCLPARLLTETGKIKLVPDLFAQDLERAKANFQTANAEMNNDFDLLLIGRRHLRSNNSWMHNSERLMRGRNRCTLLINAETASAKNLEHGATVRLESRVGAIEIPLETTDDIAPNVVSLPHGFGHTGDGVKLDVATNYAGASLNDLTDDLRLDALTGNAAFSGVPVKIRMKAEG
jgi:anaerobic selenocysteine-containing dehydrogenase